MTDGAPTFGGVHIFIRDMSETIAFYRHLGIEVTPWGEHFARAFALHANDTAHI